ncbi:sensor histidine kinase [Flavobacterium sp.]|uniref:sensor histidine kinase n=1 Tax=Flavobacterium sp. TaxID=239 RepID=UPI0025C39AF9|nr:sensor histidine kinase [Flavobacterium sp.]
MLPYIFTAEGSFLRIPKILSNGHDRTYFSVYFCLLLFFYLNYYYLTPRLYFGQKKTLYFFILSLFLCFFLFMAFFFDRPEVTLFGEGSPDFKHPVQGIPHSAPKIVEFGDAPMMKPNQHAHTILIYLTGVLASLFLSISRRLQATESDKMEAELSLLKAQINPHFLFNTLNSIYALAIRKDEKTADSVVQLSELMRYIMNNANTHQIELDKEIVYINNYIALQKSRLGDTAKIEYMCVGTLFGKKITPLILISFIENAFKHGVNPDEISEIQISIEIVGDHLTLFVANRKVHSVSTEGGIGMANTIERLEMLYAGRHNLQIKDDEENYSVKLNMDL